MLLRAVALGTATGGRTFAPLVAVVFTRPTPVAVRAAALLLGGGEVVADKLAKTPSRTEPPGLVARAVTSGIGAGLLARRAAENVAVPAVAAVTAAVGAAFAARAYRAWVAGRGWPDLPAALAEDGWSMALAFAAART